ncbi:hypothetical protein T310_3491 [Rasamsonia emersonii CBS 393.64]|uniref:Rhodopsin domain-containing protein n=1 Tax=Rasamsonia emersonii (strain ATCC 16479 / CBS 393.64 / IMI 116815) TaxID=1408163 RepID=A0A0F4YXY3_RASE3|nr:hypothetical protein T310_3491 [Rasamsonia emersonii CBS 393.64]KKA22493.1 hypothetical protein T310_3491 [Rasamsonia emersonii CBS 393.64]
MWLKTRRPGESPNSRFLSSHELSIEAPPVFLSWRAQGDKREDLSLVSHLPFQAEDVFILLSWGVFLTVAILYIVVTPVLYRVDDVMSGKSPPYAAIEQDALFIIKIFFANTLLYWLTLWAVKLSLLFLYQRLFKGLQNQMRWWWAVLIFTIVKLSVGAVFSIGIICIIMSIVRVVQVGSKAKNDSTPSSSWLAFWGMIEAGIAVVISCLPAFAIIYRKTRNSRRQYGSGYTEMPSYGNPQGIPLSTTTISAKHSRSRSFGNSTFHGHDTVTKPGKISVTQTINNIRHAQMQDSYVKGIAT